MHVSHLTSQVAGGQQGVVLPLDLLCSASNGRRRLVATSFCLDLRELFPERDHGSGLGLAKARKGHLHHFTDSRAERAAGQLHRAATELGKSASFSLLSGLQTQQIQIQRFLRLAVSGVGIVSSLGSGGLTACKGRICFSLWIDVREPRKPERRMCRIGRNGLIGKVTWRQCERDFQIMGLVC